MMSVGGVWLMKLSIYIRHDYLGIVNYNHLSNSAIQ
ncbi:hypothetical protein BofuT4_uP140000.1 [Botrytis cinerea T4]|uniref:Uncharacterized protein n=1 Tax=Botryotinia fuckeliana (strain T4) TaxID=999810 RepID=G2YYP0_BOTF4|nr:hypothetical protein BofuT4_uP140000.1 [Botrytis cinerea T4]